MESGASLILFVGNSLRIVGGSLTLGGRRGGWIRPFLGAIQCLPLDFVDCLFGSAVGRGLHMSILFVYVTV